MAKLSTETIMERLLCLAGELSPENLCCDGELSQKQVDTKYKALMKKWLKYEKMLGRTFTESEVLEYFVKEEAKQIASMEKTAKLLSAVLED